MAAVFQRLVFRASDLAARYGGEEFAVILPSTDQDGAREVAERIRAEVAAAVLPHAGSEVAAHVTLSLGVATVLPGADGHPRSLVSQADQALYAAKKDGRNRVAVVAAATEPPDGAATGS